MKPYMKISRIIPLMAQSNKLLSFSSVLKCLKLKLDIVMAINTDLLVVFSHLWTVFLQIFLLAILWGKRLSAKFDKIENKFLFNSKRCKGTSGLESNKP